LEKIEKIPEEILQYIWKTLSFDTQNLKTTSEYPISIIHQGILNNHDGPDFLEAKIKIGNVLWAGAVEIHIKSSDWLKHKHSSDSKYQNVILHVVWEHDKDISNSDGSEIPVLEIKEKINQKILQNYFYLKENNHKIPCEAIFGNVKQITKYAMLDKVQVERMAEKSKLFSEMVLKTNKEEAAYQLFVKSLGLKYNELAFEELTQNLPLKLLQKHSNNLIQIEAFLFGASGLLKNHNGNYEDLLNREFHFLQHKYQDKFTTINANNWKFLGLRPANFPTIRLAQLAFTIHNITSFYSFFSEKEISEIIDFLHKIETSVYWQTHYVFGKESVKKKKKLGELTIRSIIINTVVPILIYRYQSEDKEEYLHKAQQILEKLPSEKNSIVSIYSEIGFIPDNAFYSQAILGLYKNYCSQKRCVECSIFNEIVKQNIISASF
jgi:hypothetical protein